MYAFVCEGRNRHSWAIIEEKRGSYEKTRYRFKKALKSIEDSFIRART